METYKNLKKGTKIGLVISIALCLIMLALNVCDLIIPPSFGGEMNPAEAPQQNITEQMPDAAMPGNTVDIPGFARPALNIVFCLIVILYAVVGYKKPHGNMLKTLFFIFAVYLLAIASIDFMGRSSEYIQNGLVAMAALIVAYISGRLNKLEKNRILLVIAGALLFIKVIMGFWAVPPHAENAGFAVMVMPVIRQAALLIDLAALGFAYTARFEEHKAAGLEDK